MSKEQRLENMGMIFNKEQIERVSVDDTEDGRDLVTVELHELTCKPARQFISNVVNVNRGDCTVCLIHGYNHGTKLKEMIYKEDFGKRVVKRESPAWNPGITYLTLAA